MDKTRDPRLDLVRSAAIFFVICVHFYDSSGFPGQTMGGAADFLMLCGWLVTHTCVPLFLLLSGWLCGKKTLSKAYYLGLIRIAGLYLLCSLACLAFRALWLREEMGLRYVFGSIVNFYACGYAWYVMLYLGLFLMIPFLNLIWANLQSKTAKRALVATAFALSILPSLLNQFIQLYSIWWTRLYPICYYFAGAYLREFCPRPRGKKVLPPLILAVVLFAAFDLVFYRSRAQAMIGVAYENYQVFTVSVLMFLCLLSAPAFEGGIKRFLTLASKLSYGMYLLSWIPDNVLYPRLIAAFPEPAARYVWMLPCALGVFFVSLILSQLAQAIHAPIEKALRKRFILLFHRK